MLLTDGLSAATSYDVVSAMPDPSVDVLATATADDPPDSIYLELPDGFADEYRPVAEEAVAGATTPYEQAIALQTWFRETFTYSLDIPASDDGDDLDDFLERRTGFCVHFASTFASFARTLGIPARVAVGFTPGEVGADGRYIVRERNAHAWPEMWLDGIGWVLFEPTPGRGAPGAEEYTGVPFQQDESGPGTADTQPPTDATLSTAPRADRSPAAGQRAPRSPRPRCAGEAAAGVIRRRVRTPRRVAGDRRAAGGRRVGGVHATRRRDACRAHDDPESQVARMWRSLVATASPGRCAGAGVEDGDRAGARRRRRDQHRPWRHPGAGPGGDRRRVQPPRADRPPPHAEP